MPAGPQWCWRKLKSPDDNAPDSMPERNAIRFYGQKGDHPCFSNFSPHPIEIDEVEWPTVEHYYQAQKFAGTPQERLILMAVSPKEAKKLGNSRTWPLRPDWESVKDDVMRKAVRRKFEAHEDARRDLLSTGDAEIIEASPWDYYWGEGKSGKGKNMLGRILMEVREELRKKE
jgi:hypothetical protein